MPPDGYTTITVPEDLLDRLDRHRSDDGRHGYAEVIDGLLDTVESQDSDGELKISPEQIDEITSMVSQKTANEVEQRLR